MLNGRCECGAITLSIKGEINDFSHCHCSQCRRLHGAAYATFAGIQLDELTYHTGEDSIAHYNSSPTHDRMFCKTCGSTIGVTVEDEPGVMYLSMSLLEGNPARPEGYHIFVGSKADWHDITDVLAQHDAFPPE